MEQKLTNVNTKNLFIFEQLILDSPKKRTKLTIEILTWAHRYLSYWFILNDIWNFKSSVNMLCSMLLAYQQCYHYLFPHIYKQLWPSNIVFLVSKTWLSIFFFILFYFIFSFFPLLLNIWSKFLINFDNLTLHSEPICVRVHTSKIFLGALKFNFNISCNAFFLR